MLSPVGFNKRALSRLFSTLLVTFVMTGCATGPQIDRSISSINQDSRVRFLIMHFTYGDSQSSLKTLTEGPVSSHYWLDIDPPKILLLVPEDRRAYHAGVSYWKGATALNASSIGIEIVNAGPRANAEGKLVYTDYPKAQIDTLITLTRDIMQRHGITPDRVLGHSDIAPGRKTDPGPKFPWKRLAQEGLAVWPDESKVNQRRSAFEAALPNVGWFQTKLKQFGYATELTAQMDAQTRDVVSAFQMRFRPENYSGDLDAHTAAILDVLTEIAPK